MYGVETGEVAAVELTKFVTFVKNLSHRSRARMRLGASESAKMQKALEKKKIRMTLETLKDTLAVNDTDEGFIMLGELLQDINLRFSQQYGVPQEGRSALQAPLHMKQIRKLIKMIIRCSAYQENILLVHRRHSNVHLVEFTTREAVDNAKDACERMLTATSNC